MPVIYLDNAATTPLDPAVREAMEPYLTDQYGNPSSTHQMGRAARRAIERAREQVGEAIDADPAEIVFTSGGTESDNAAIMGAAVANRKKGRHIVTTSIEHHAVLHTCEFLEKIGFSVTYVPPGENGIVSSEEVRKAIRPDTTVVSVMHVNNETGAIQPIEEIADICREQEILFHTDAVQAVGLLPIRLKQTKIDLLSLSAHKLHGPKGVGVLYVRRGIAWTPILHGGSQERKKRAGTENVSGIVGLGAAMERTMQQQTEHYKQIVTLRNRMLAVLTEELDDLQINSPEESVPSILSLSFPNVSAETLLMNLDMEGIAASSGSACTSGSLQPSHVLMAMKRDENCVKSVIRFSFSNQNTVAEVETAARKTAAIVNRLRRK
ncbi:cysteine desulfurase family protein [Effusibacillus dendaii]|uniref:cysteine desulfurase n=1 Tax=Effusibacillus dendaii TaxID=2743772 RepID=A0A7I8DAB1_9BACL|nr:cysteine desulfurase family protein [Effusibacillus dendaii]BCJ86302.1 cysteine desulfurase NifS [Effusibacillus dendaii]